MPPLKTYIIKIRLVVKRVGNRAYLVVSLRLKSITIEHLYQVLLTCMMLFWRKSSRDVCLIIRIPLSWCKNKWIKGVRSGALMSNCWHPKSNRECSLQCRLFMHALTIILTWIEFLPKSLNLWIFPKCLMIYSRIILFWNCVANEVTIHHEMNNWFCERGKFGFNCYVTPFQQIS